MTAVLAPLLAKLFAVLAAGALLRAHLPPRTKPLVDRIILDGAMPVLLLLVLMRMRVDPAVTIAAVPLTLAQVVTAALALLAGRAMGLSRPAQGSAAMTTTFANTGFLGAPVVLALFHTDGTAAATAVLLDAICTTAWMWSFGVLLAARYGGGRPFSWRGLARPLLRPLTLCIVLGLALSLAGVSLPSQLDGVAPRLGLAVSVLVFFSLGLSLDVRALRRNLRPALVMAALKLVFMPLVVLAAVHAMALPEPLATVAVLQGAMPSAMVSVLISIEEGCDAGLAAGIAALTTLACLATLPAVAWLAEAVRLATA